MVQHKLVVDKGNQTLYVLNQGRMVAEMPCSTGNGIPANGYSGITPNGVYSIADIVDSKDLVWDGDPRGQRKPYGPWMFTLDDNPRGLAIHGTDEPQKLGLAVTHGCIRVSYDDITRLKENYVDIGTLVEIIGK